MSEGLPVYTTRLLVGPLSDDYNERKYERNEVARYAFPGKNDHIKRWEDLRAAPERTGSRRPDARVSEEDLRRDRIPHS